MPVRAVELGVDDDHRLNEVVAGRDVGDAVDRRSEIVCVDRHDGLGLQALDVAAEERHARPPNLQTRLRHLVHVRVTITKTRPVIGPSWAWGMNETSKRSFDAAAGRAWASDEADHPTMTARTRIVVFTSGILTRSATLNRSLADNDNAARSTSVWADSWGRGKTG